jgi:hypothetical protein
VVSSRRGHVFAAILLAGLSPSETAAAGQQPGASQDRQLVFPEGRPTGLTGEYWMAALANDGPMPRHERLLVVLPDGRVRDVVDGERDHVLLPVELTRELAERRLRVTLVHNHVTASGLSGADLRHLAKPGVATVVAVTSDDSLYEASAAARYGLFPDGHYQVLFGRVRDRLANEAWREREPLSALVPHLPHLVATVLHRARVIDYRISASLTLRVDAVRFHSLFERVVLAELRVLEQELGVVERASAR